MAIVRVQRVNKGTAGSNVSSVSNANNFGVNTTMGNLLVCVCAAASFDPSVLPVDITPPTTPGFTWTFLGEARQTTPIKPGGSNFTTSAVAIFYIENAASMSSATLTTFSGFTSGNQNTIQVGGILLEYSGVPASFLAGPTVATAIGQVGAAGQNQPALSLFTPVFDGLDLVAECDSNSGSVTQVPVGYTSMGGGANHIAAGDQLNITGPVAPVFGNVPNNYGWCCIGFGTIPSGGGGGPSPCIPRCDAIEVVYESGGIVRLLTGQLDQIQDIDYELGGFGTEVAVNGAGLTTHAWGNQNAFLIKRPTFVRFNTNRDPATLANDGWVFGVLGIDDDFYTFFSPLTLALTPGVNDTSALCGNPDFSSGLAFRHSPELFRIAGVNFVMGRRLKFQINFPSAPGANYQLRGIQIGFGANPPS